MTDVPTSGTMFFEDLKPDTVIVSPARTVTEHDVAAFAGLSGDYNPLHTDAEFARATPYGERIAHGLLGLSIASGLASRVGVLEGSALAFRDLEWQFRRPILFGDTIHTVVRVKTCREAPAMGGGLVSFDVRLLNHRDEVVQRGVWNVLVRLRPVSGAGAGAAG